MESLKPLFQWLGEYEVVLWWSFAISLALLVLSPLAVAWVVVKLPTDYFTTKRRRRARWMRRYPELQPAIAIAKNVLGILLVFAGIVMLVVPGQGLLTLVAGLMLIDFPGKYRLERWLATRPPVWRSINWLRKRASREPLQPPE
jgi:hypothetical protein